MRSLSRSASSRVIASSCATVVPGGIVTASAMIASVLDRHHAIGLSRPCCLLRHLRSTACSAASAGLTPLAYPSQGGAGAYGQEDPRERGPMLLFSASPRQ
jgi:hypothetical protein